MWNSPTNRRMCSGVYGTSSSHRYAGTRPSKALYVSKMMLNPILCFPGSQCRLTRIGVIWSYLCHLMTLLARFMGPIWGPTWADRTQVGPMLTPWTLLSRDDVHEPHDVDAFEVGISAPKEWQILSYCSNPASILWWYSPTFQQWVDQDTSIFCQWNTDSNLLIYTHSQNDLWNEK